MKQIRIFLLALPGLLLGYLSVLGIPGDAEPWFWLVLGLIQGTVLIWFFSEKILIHAFFTGLLTGIFHFLLISLLMETYLLNNPDAAQTWTETAGEQIPEGFVLFTGLVISALYGSALALLSWGIAKFKNSTPAG
ncbi:MAG: hypothetical protein L6Q77_05115 [Bacteroidetes bacterium]|nr:hypothetical protein [Bacteroidota bacterium]